MALCAFCYQDPQTGIICFAMVFVFTAWQRWVQTWLPVCLSVRPR